MPAKFNPAKDYYSTLLVPPTATGEEITASWRRLASAVHPDMHPGAEARATALLKELNEARDVLVDTQARVAYDAARRARTQGAASTSQSTTPPQPVSRSEWLFPWWSVVLAAFVFFPAGLLILILNLAMRNRHVVIRSHSRGRGWRMSPTAMRFAAFGVLFVVGGLLSGAAMTMANAPAGSAAATWAGPVTGLALVCDFGMAALVLGAMFRWAVGAWRGMDPGQRRGVLLGVGAWLLWRGFWREMRRARAG